MTSEQSGEQSGGFADAVRRYVDQVVGDLSKRGEARTKDIQKAARELADRSARDRRELFSLVSKEIRRQIEALGLARNTEVEELKERIDQLEAERNEH